MSLPQLKTFSGYTNLLTKLEGKTEIIHRPILKRQPNILIVGVVPEENLRVA
jgi:hypothetical protein